MKGWKDMTRNEFIEAVRILKDTEPAKDDGKYSYGIYFAIGCLASAFCRGDSEKTKKLLEDIGI